MKWSPLIQLSLHSFASSPADTFSPSFLSRARSRSGGEIILTTCPYYKPSLPCCFNYLQIPHFKVHNCDTRSPSRLTVGTRLNDAVIPILLCLIVITLTDTRPNVGLPGLGEAGEAQSIVYKHRKTFPNSLGQQKDKAKHKEEHLHGSYGADVRP